VELWRTRATKLRADALKTRDTDHRQKMLVEATQVERLAEREEMRLAAF
jgi:hypothetical protein